MKKNALKTCVTIVGAVIALAACGGGDDDQAGQKTVFSVSPDESNLTWDQGTGCNNIGKVGDFLVMGGTAPYDIRSSFKEIVITDVTQLPDRNTQFSVVISGCGDPLGVITILDALGRSVTATVGAASS